MKKNNNKKKNKTVDLTNVNLNSNNPGGYFNRLKARTPNQASVIKTIDDNIISFCIGSAGTGKTHIAVGMAISYLMNNNINKIIITRPVVESGEKLGYLPGTAEEKLHPYLLPILDEIVHFIPISQYITLKTQNKIEIVPLALMRGRNFHNSFIVADECQNASYDQLKMLLTRIGDNSKMVLTGDASQSDLHRSMRGGFMDIASALKDVTNIGMFQLENSDIVRNPIISTIISKLDIYEESTGKK